LGRDVEITRFTIVAAGSFAEAKIKNTS
jgi:hypothetical protein